MVVAQVALATHSEAGSLGGLVRNPKALTLNCARLRIEHAATSGYATAHE
jgi:hypothetical protein